LQVCWFLMILQRYPHLWDIDPAICLFNGYSSWWLCFHAYDSNIVLYRVLPVKQLIKTYTLVVHHCLYISDSHVPFIVADFQLQGYSYIQYTM